MNYINKSHNHTARKLFAFAALAFLSIGTKAATPIELSELELWGIENILNAEEFAIVVNGKANIIDTPNITKISSLYERFYENEIAVLQAYKGKPRLISFPVGRVAIEQGKPIVYGAWSAPKVKYEFDDAATSALAKVGRGSIFSAMCTLKSISRAELEFMECKNGQIYIDNHISSRRSEILEYLQGRPASRPETSRQALTLLSLINSKPPHSPCLQRPPPEFTCFSELENHGKNLISPDIRARMISRLNAHGFNQ